MEEQTKKQAKETYRKSVINLLADNVEAITHTTPEALKKYGVVVIELPKIAVHHTCKLPMRDCGNIEAVLQAYFSSLINEFMADVETQIDRNKIKDVIRRSANFMEYKDNESK